MMKTQEFNRLHNSEDILFLGNAWDLLSSFTLEKVGVKAIGTTSWGIANSVLTKVLEFKDTSLLYEN